MNRSMVLLLLIVVLAGSIWGCGRMRQKKEKEHGVEYTVLGEDQIPDEIRKVVDVKKGDWLRIYVTDGQIEAQVTDTKKE